MEGLYRVHVEKIFVLVSIPGKNCSQRKALFQASGIKSFFLAFGIIVKEYSFLCMKWDRNADRPAFAAADATFLNTGHMHSADMNVLFRNS